MERLIEPVTLHSAGEDAETRRANFVGKHKGLWWQPPGMDIADGQDLWLVEGCIDAISLHLHGIPAVATLSAGNYPEIMLADLAARAIRPRLVWALDNDKAGRGAIERHVKAARDDGWDCRAALVPQPPGRKADWNDAHGAGALEPADIERCRYHGDLLLAPSALEKGLLIWRRHRSISFGLEHGSRTWWWELPQSTYAATLELVAKEMEAAGEEEIRWEAARRSAVAHEIANVAFKFLYFQRSALTDEAWYYARVTFPHGRHDTKDTFTGAQVAAAAEFKKRLLSVAPGALYSGSTAHLNWLIKHHLDTIRIVDTVNFIGYSKPHKTWVFGDLAVSGGRVYQLNDEDFFEIGRTSVKSLSRSLALRVGPKLAYRPDWVDLVYSSFGAKGLVAAAFFLGSLFAEQIRELQQSFPFLEIVGEAGAGKSTLIEFLWKLLGRPEYEGFDPNKSTLAARARIMSQVSNLPVSFIESDRGDDKGKHSQFDWDEIKTAFNGRGSRARGVANGGNDTDEPPFRGSILITQNAPVVASEAIMSRIIHLYFDTSGHTAGGKVAADTLASLPVESLSHFLVEATTRETEVMAVLAQRASVHEAEFLARPSIRMVRIAKCHGQLMALVEALAKLTNMPDAWRDAALAVLSDGAERRQATIATDNVVVDEFWDLVDYLGLGTLNHQGPDSGVIALNLNQVMSAASKAGLPMPALIDLKRHLKDSRSRPFVDVKTVRSVQTGFSTVKCWVFWAHAGKPSGRAMG